MKIGHRQETIAKEVPTQFDNVSTYKPTWKRNWYKNEMQIKDEDTIRTILGVTGLRD
jgi:hypothetical protein